MLVGMIPKNSLVCPVQLEPEAQAEAEAANSGLAQKWEILFTDIQTLDVHDTTRMQLATKIVLTKSVVRWRR